MASAGEGEKAAPPKAASTGYIVGPIYDSVFFLYAPLFALVLGICISKTTLASEKAILYGREVYPSSVLIGTFIAAHLVIVLLRSHGNREVFKRHPLRFTLVPLLLFLAVFASDWVMVSVTVIAIWWDVYHSSMQTFGLGRLYDRKRGNDLEQGRRLDQWINHLFYIGPILGGAALMDHVDYFDNFKRVESVFFTAVPARVESIHGILTWIVLGVGTPFLIYYVYAYWRMAKNGYTVSPQKVFLLASTGFCSIYTWGFNSFGEAFFIMNFFHAWQYFAIVWWSEGKSLRRLFRMEAFGLGKPVTLLLFVALPVGYGYFVTAVMPALDNNRILFCVALVVSIMHFWFDGFIWSVRKKHI